MFNILKNYMRMKIEKFEKLVANLHNKNEYVVDTRNLKQALVQGLVLKNIQRAITFNQKAWLVSYIKMNTELRRKAKNDFAMLCGYRLFHCLYKKGWYL